MLRYKPTKNAHVLTCTLRFLVGLRLAFGQNLAVLKPVYNRLSKGAQRLPELLSAFGRVRHFGFIFYRR
jgi:hypothetical protein